MFKPPPDHLAIRLLAFAFCCALLVQCEDRDGPATSSAQQAVGLGWGDPDPPASTSTVPAPQSVFLGEISPPAMRSPLRIAVGSNGDIVVSDPAARRVHVLNAIGTPRFSLPFGRPLGVTVDGTGNIYVGDAKTGSVKIFDADGDPVGWLGAGNGEFGKPNDLAWHSGDDTIHVVDSAADTVRVYAVEGASSSYSYGATGSADGQFRFPIGIVVGADGRVHVTDHTNARIQSSASDGTGPSTLCSYGSGLGELNRPHGLAIDAIDGQQRLYVTDAFQSRLQVVDTAGLHISYLGDSGRGEGELSLSADAVIDSFGRLLVTSYHTGKIVVFGIDDYSEPPPCDYTDCDDGNVCTTGTCDPPTGACSQILVADGADCGDGNACNGAEVCLAGSCIAGVPVSCDDGDSCSLDTCDSATGTCAHAPEPGCDAPTGDCGKGCKRRCKKQCKKQCKNVCREFCSAMKGKAKKQCKKQCKNECKRMCKKQCKNECGPCGEGE